MRDEDKARLIEILKRELIGVKLGARYNHPIEDKRFWETMRHHEPDTYYVTVATTLREEVKRLGLRAWAKDNEHVQNIFTKARAIKRRANNVR